MGAGVVRQTHHIGPTSDQRVWREAKNGAEQGTFFLRQGIVTVLKPRLPLFVVISLLSLQPLLVVRQGTDTYVLCFSFLFFAFARSRSFLL